MRSFAILCLIGVMTACSPGQSGDTRAEARAAFQAYADALNTGDIEAAAAMYDTEEGFHWVERGGIQYENGADAAVSLGNLTAGGAPTRMTVDTIRVADLGDGAALVSAHFDFAMLSTEGVEQFSFDGWMTVGMVKRATGWRIAGGQVGPGLAE